MYAFRKPFTAGTFEFSVWGGVGYKTVLVAAQMAGYTISKFLGIKFVSEIAPRYRAVMILVLIAIAEVALLLFAITPAPWNFIWLFVNGLPLGMVFGLVLGFLEGRKLTEALSAGLCASFIVSSGVVKSVGRAMMQHWGISEFWMPFLTGLLFVLPLLIAVWLLSQIPPPSQSDVEHRSPRRPMDGSQRKSFFRRHAVGLIGLLVIYVLLTIGRSIRDDFAVEIWRDLGVSDEPDVFAKSEFWVMIAVVTLNGLACLIQNNRIAFLSSLALTGFGFLFVMGTIIGQTNDMLSPMSFMILLGVGMYIPYVAFHTTVFERLFAAFRETGTIGYLIYLADAIGYLGYVCIMLLRNVISSDINFLDLLIWVSVAISSLAIVITLFLCAHFHQRIPHSESGDKD